MRIILKKNVGGHVSQVTVIFPQFLPSMASTMIRTFLADAPLISDKWCDTQAVYIGWLCLLFPAVAWSSDILEDLGGAEVLFKQS